MSDPATIPSFDSLAETVAEIAASSVPVAEIISVTNRLAGAGITASDLRAIRAAGLAITLGPDEPKLERPRIWYVAVQRWPVPCRACGVEVKRGELGSLGKLRDGTWVVECASCRAVDERSERAEAARRWALDKEMSVGGDGEELIERMVEHAPDLREQVEDLLMVVVAAREGE